MSKDVQSVDNKRLKGSDYKKVMSVAEGIYSRRSVRNFTFEQVSDHTIHQLLATAVRAPSAMNLQPWAFAIIQKQDWLRYISDRSKEFLSHQSKQYEALLSDSNFDIFYGATTLIVIYGKSEGFCPVGDCYLAAENLMIAAYGMGLGTCPIGLARDFLQSEEMKKELDIPKEYQVVLPIIVGYPAEHPKQTPRDPPKIFNWIN